MERKQKETGWWIQELGMGNYGESENSNVLHETNDRMTSREREKNDKRNYPNLINTRTGKFV